MGGGRDKNGRTKRKTLRSNNLVHGCVPPAQVSSPKFTYNLLTDSANKSQTENLLFLSTVNKPDHKVNTPQLLASAGKASDWESEGCRLTSRPSEDL